MNQILSFPRLGRYFKYEIQLGMRTYLMCFGALIGLMLLPVINGVYFDTYVNYTYTEGLQPYSSYDNPDDPMHGSMRSLFFLGLFLSCCIGASYTFSNLKGTTDRISALMLPASQLEKYIVRWAIYVPAIILAYILAFEIVDLIRCLMVALRFPHTDSCHVFDTAHTLFHDEIPVLWGVLPLLQSLFVLGSIIWPKRSMLKTALALFLIGLVSMIYVTLLSDLLLDSNMHYGFDSSVEPALVLWWITGGSFFFALVFYVIAYYRYKEIEIIQRW